MLKGILNLQITQKIPVEYEILERFTGKNSIQYFLLESKTEGLFVVRKIAKGEHYSQFKHSDLLLTKNEYFIFLEKISAMNEFSIYKGR